MSRRDAALPPPLRWRTANDAPIRGERRYVLYWMTAARRLRANYALDRAVALASSLRRPLVILEALACDYPHASERLHHFVLAGMRDHAAALRSGPVRYYPYVEQAPRAGRGLLEALADHACAVVTDDSPAFFLPRLVEAAARRVDVRFEAVDSNGLLPLRAVDRAYPSAHTFRRVLQHELLPHLAEPPRGHPLGRAELASGATIPRDILTRWPPASRAMLSGGALSLLQIDHDVPPVEDTPGGPLAGARRLAAFIADGLPRYDQARHPDADAASGLSPYLHFGHIGAHEVFHATAEAEGWAPERLTGGRAGGRRDWWGMSSQAEAFLDQLVTWRELAYNAAAHLDGYDEFRTLPLWARRTLARHARDARAHVYRRGEFDEARTHDPVWNAAQRQLVGEGRIDNYLRMLWGKKILEWSPSSRRALALMLALNDRYALDGRDPNSVSGIFWVLGRYDRAWGPERPVYGTVRYMSSERTRQKLRLARYLERWGGDSAGAPRRRGRTLR